MHFEVSLLCSRETGFHIFCELETDYSFGPGVLVGYAQISSTYLFFLPRFRIIGLCDLLHMFFREMDENGSLPLTFGSLEKHYNASFLLRIATYICTMPGKRASLPDLHCNAFPLQHSVPVRII